jgi:hypothetical protein
MSEDIGTRVHRPAIYRLANRERNHGCYHEPDVADDTERLDLRHDARKERGDQPVYDDTSDVGGIHDWAGSSPLPIAGNRHEREQHGRKPIYIMCVSIRLSYHQTGGALHAQSIEQTPPTRPIVLLYPTTKLRGFFHFSSLK